MSKLIETYYPEMTESASSLSMALLWNMPASQLAQLPAQLAAIQASEQHAAQYPMIPFGIDAITTQEAAK